MFPIAAVVHAGGVNAHLHVHWLVVVTLIPLACLAMTSLGLVLGTTFEPRNIGLMWGFVVLPLTFLGGTYYQWTKLAPVQVAGIHWLQILVLINPLIYVTEGMRAGLTPFSHLHLYIIYPVLVAFSARSCGSGCGTSAGACSSELLARDRRAGRRPASLVLLVERAPFAARAGAAGPSSPSTTRSRRSRQTCHPAQSRAALSRVPSATVKRSAHPAPPSTGSSSNRR